MPLCRVCLPRICRVSWDFPGKQPLHYAVLLYLQMQFASAFFVLPNLIVPCAMLQLLTDPDLHEDPPAVTCHPCLSSRPTITHLSQLPTSYRACSPNTRKVSLEFSAKPALSGAAAPDSSRSSSGSSSCALRFSPFLPFTFGAKE